HACSHRSRCSCHASRNTVIAAMALIAPLLLTASLAGTAPPPGWQAPSIPGHLPQWDCREIPVASPSPDTLRLNLDQREGPVRLLREGRALEKGEDVEWVGDTVAIVPAVGGTLCI